MTAKVPQCVCREQFSGGSCEVCAPGYEENGERCDPIEINCADDPCVGGTCERNASDPDTCTCGEGYAGPTCAQCGAGFQDNDENGTCLPSCSSTTELLCEDYQVCRDSSGTASCGCPLGMGGALCEGCESGYYRLGDGPCMPSCAVIESCGENAHCVDVTDDGASCTCLPGFGGQGCASCAEGFIQKADHCVAAPQSGQLVGIANIAGYATLARIDATSGRVEPIFALEQPEGFSEDAFGPLGDPLNGWNAVTRDPDSGRYWLSYSKRVGDSATDYFLMSLEPDATPTIYDDMYFRGRIAFVPDDNAIYGLYSAGVITLAKFDIATGTMTSMGVTGIADGGGTNLTSLVWEPETKKLLAYGSEHQGNTGFYEIDRSTGVGSFVRELDLSALPQLDGFSEPGIPSMADGPDGSLFVVTSRSHDAESWQEVQCRELAKRAGYSESEAAAFTGSPDGFRSETSPIVIESAQNQGPEIVAVTGYIGDPVEVQIATSNPDAFLCLVTFEGEFALRVMADAKFALGVLHSYRNFVKVAVDEAYVPPVPAPIYTNITVASPDAQLSGKEEIDPSFLGHADVFRILTRRQWADRRFDEYESPSVDTNVRVHHIVTVGADGKATAQQALDAPVQKISAW